jgi:hypothetical protein
LTDALSSAPRPTTRGGSMDAEETVLVEKLEEVEKESFVDTNIFTG